ncbi:MAG: Grx4 family monothiol glutaredoxin [Chlamydiae bacterium]|nr:Grx4 family monothiol glutaredoxin [Chlamydiota bacterium]MBI3277225.1 Grx4 family monothiol glutaredoxin [Chlamydiota bacterium]
MSHPLHQKIDEKIKSNPVLIFMKGTPEEPQCGFSAKACEVLKAAGVKNLVGVNVLADDALWEALEDYTQWPTVPQIFIHGNFIGGCDIVTEMYERGELQEMLKEEGHQ